MKLRIIQLILLFICCAACSFVPGTDVAPPNITLEEAMAKGYPIYLPSADILQSMGISNSPTLKINTEDRNCTYLSVYLPYENTPSGQLVEWPAIKMLISDGCTHPDWMGYPTKLSWAIEGQAIRLGEDFVDVFPPNILFIEPTNHYQYVVFSEESFKDTMTILESMKLLNP